MKKLSIIYWITTGLMSALMLLGSFVDLSQAPDALALIKHLGYPAYFVPFIGLVRLLGVVAVLIPGFPKVKEWAYAGLVYDTAGAIFSHISTGDGPDKWAPALLSLILVVTSYIFYTKRAKRHTIN
jgi:hypothetical protein